MLVLNFAVAVVKPCQARRPISNPVSSVNSQLQPGQNFAHIAVPHSQQLVLNAGLNYRSERSFVGSVGVGNELAERRLQI